MTKAYVIAQASGFFFYLDDGDVGRGLANNRRRQIGFQSGAHGG